MQRPMIIAHRGGRSDLPENSMAAVRRAWNLGVDAVEVDVQVTLDGRVAVFHDETTQRMTGQSGVLSDLTMSELEAMRLLHPATGMPSDCPIHGLEDFLPLVPPAGTFVIELKSAGALPQAVCSALEKAPVDQAQIILISFHLEALQFCKKCFPKIRSLWLFRDWYEAKLSIRRDRLKIIQDEELEGVDIKFNSGLTPEHLADLKSNGFMTFTYTVNQVDEWRLAAELGLDGVTSDFPERALDFYLSQ